MEVNNSYRSVAAGDWKEKVDWCYKNLYHGGHYEPTWRTEYPFIYFDDEQEYVAFLLRFGK